jgi:hypothetical protein
MLGVAGILTAGQLAVTAKWPYSGNETIVLVVAVGYTATQGILDTRRWRRQNKRIESRPAALAGERRLPENSGMTVFLSVLLALAFLLTASLSGMRAADQLLHGCGSGHSVVFRPPPPGFEANQTYWLVLHNNGVYYVKDLPLESGARTVAVPEDPGRAVSVVALGPTRECFR